jgi:hypothetical protein
MYTKKNTQHIRYTFKVNYRVHCNSLSVIPILNPLLAFTLLSEDPIFRSSPSTLKHLFPSGVCVKTWIFVPTICHMLHTSHPLQPDKPNHMWRIIQTTKFLICTLPVTLLSQNIFRNISSPKPLIYSSIYEVLMTVYCAYDLRSVLSQPFGHPEITEQ